MEQFWRKKSFKVLLTEWNTKLTKSGFVDHEVELKGDRSLKQRAVNCYGKASHIERESRLDYYLFLSHLIQTTPFPNELEKIVMLRHSEGATIKEIVNEINASGIARERQTVRYIIRRWQMKWGIRSWSLRQMNLKK